MDKAIACGYTVAEDKEGVECGELACFFVFNPVIRSLEFACYKHIIETASRRATELSWLTVYLHPIFPPMLIKAREPKPPCTDRGVEDFSFGKKIDMLVLDDDD